MRFRRAPSLSAFSVIAFLFVLTDNSALGAPRLIAWSGTQATGEVDGVSFTNFGTTTLNRFGETAFLAGVAGPGIVAGEDVGVWSGGVGGIARIVRGGLPVPNDETAIYGGFNPPVLDVYGSTSFVGQVKFPGGTPPAEVVVISGSPDGAAPLYRRGDAAPELDGPTFSGSNLILLRNAVGQSAFNATVAGSGVTFANDGVIYVEDGAGALRLVAREGDPVPDMPAGVNFGSLALDFALNNAGQVAFHGSLTGPGITTANDRGIWIENGGVPHLVARTGTQAPGAPAGSDFVSFLATGLQTNDQGHVAFIGFNEATQVPFTINDQGIWSDRTGTLAPIAIKRQSAPGIGGDVVLTAFREVTLNAVDEAAYIGALEGPGVNSDNSWGLWSEALGGVRLVAREGTAAPGVSDGAVFNFFQGLAMNRWGQTAFYGSVRGTGVTAANDNGLWAEDINGTLHLIVREGDTIEVAPGEMRTVQGLGIVGGSAGQDGRRTGFNDRGQFVTYTEFTDGSVAILLWDDVVALPGDFNADGTVDAADYTVWRDRLGSAFDADDYQRWKENLGQTIGSGGGSSNLSVPEPMDLWPVVLSLAVGIASIRHPRNDGS